MLTDEKKKKMVEEPVQATQTAQPVQNTEQVPVEKTPVQNMPQATAQQNVQISDENYNKAISALTSAKNTMPTYAGTYDAQLNDIYDQIVNRDKFKYDLNADMLYQQYKDQYVDLGRMAMKDTMGQAAALTGGYGSSYGQAVGQQQYDAYLQKLNDVVPELYGMALDQYNAEGDRLNDMYALTGDMADTEYGRYQDSLDQYWQDRDYNYSTLMSLINSSGYAPNADEIAAAGMTQGQVDALLKAWQSKNPDLAYRTGKITAGQYYKLTGQYPAGYTPTASGGNEKKSSGGKFDQEVYDLQAEMRDAGFNIAVDGIRGPETEAAAHDYMWQKKIKEMAGWTAIRGY